jgi:type II secretory pathway component PulL
MGGPGKVIVVLLCMIAAFVMGMLVRGWQVSYSENQIRQQQDYLYRQQHCPTVAVPLCRNGTDCC